MIHAGIAMLIITENNAYRIDSPQDEPRPVNPGAGTRRGAVGHGVEIIAKSGGEFLAIYDRGRTVSISSPIAEPVTSVLPTCAEPLEILAGTEGAHIYRVSPSLTRRIEAFEELSCRKEWHTPWGGPPAVRSLAGTKDGWVYADIHVGSIMLSPDGGENWAPVTPSLDEDVHQVATCPASDDNVYANTASAVYVSTDRGQSWDHRADDLGERYGRAIAVAPDNPKLILASVSDGPHGDNVHGQLYRSEDMGRSWSPAGGDFPQSTPDNINTHQVAFTSCQTAWAAVESELYFSTDGGERWKHLWSAEREIIMLAC